MMAIWDRSIWDRTIWDRATGTGLSGTVSGTWLSGRRCKYYVTVLGKSKTFAQEMLTLRADRLRTLYSSDATLTCPVKSSRESEFPYPPQYQQELIFCHMWMFAEVERTGKWGISLLEYGQDYYPPYCSGFFVVIMPAIVEDIYQAAKATPFLWLDDVFIYGVVREEMHFVQIVNLDEVAYRQEHYRDCYKAYGYRW
uniref:Hexosyltransferase n=1 Tax=Biomphalaria glabrata TaxID=6526 RepID=A0A2C9LE82_BIOGL